jgi:COMPASS component BRE2
MRTLPGSSIKIYKNGVDKGVMFKDLLAFLPPASKPAAGQVGARDGCDDGNLGYFPAVSVFRGGAVETNFGPDFWFPPPQPPGYEAQQAEKKPVQDDVEMEDEDMDEVDMIGSAPAPAPLPPAQTRPSKSVTIAATPSASAENVTYRPVADRYTDAIAEDVLADIVDEVDFWVSDGCTVPEHAGSRVYQDYGRAAVEEGGEGGAEGPLGEDGGIKELIQDD